MPKVKLYDMTGKELGTKDLSEAVFGIEPNMAVLHEAVKNFLANQRQGTQSTLTRTEVAGGGRKPWRQKGTGHARQGSTRAPHWYHGGVALGPKPRDYSYSLNRKVKKLAFRSAFSAKVKDNEMMVIDQITMDEYKTKDIVKLLNALGVEKKALIVLPEVNEKVIKSAANIPGVKTAVVGSLNVYDILNYNNFIIAAEAVEKLEEVYA
ncbi:MAG: 50S ribosomal protein L4 [Oscillospiraceae bacterium]|nr:50S ribosomal protein L4 [Pseudomonas sp.]MBP1558942.1 50S ribosomal protein L4 [Oscillospiraceae bacterium]